MDDNIKNILNDLYAIDGHLKKNEKELIEIIQKLIASKPNIKFDENFRNRLREELLEKFSQVDNKKINFNFMNKLTYAFGALAILLLVIIPTFFKSGDRPEDNKLLANIDFGLEVDRLGKDAFGRLAAHDTDTPENFTAGLGGGGGVATVDQKMIVPYEPIIYKYVYEGEDFSIDENQMAVLKKVKGLSSQGDAAKILQSLNFDNIDLSSLNNTKLRNFTVYEDKDFGYSVNIDLYEGMISLNEYWEKWPMDREPVLGSIKIEDIPSDDKLIAMANKFLQERGISTASYGAPIVDNSWRQGYLRFENKQEFVVPDMATIVYPTVVDGKEVYEDWGGVQGLRISVNLKYNRVSSVWNLSSNKYQSSIYDMETDVDRILALAGQGGTYYPVSENNNYKIVEIKIGTPHIAYVQTWIFEDNTNSQLLVPALIFPIINIPDEVQYFYKENVVVPLAKDIVSQRAELYQK